MIVSEPGKENEDKNSSSRLSNCSKAQPSVPTHNENELKKQDSPIHTCNTSGCITAPVGKGGTSIDRRHQQENSPLLTNPQAPGK
jgi:hypothetical protein